VSQVVVVADVKQGGCMSMPAPFSAANMLCTLDVPSPAEDLPMRAAHPTAILISQRVLPRDSFLSPILIATPEG